MTDDERAQLEQNLRDLKVGYDRMRKWHRPLSIVARGIPVRSVREGWDREVIQPLTEAMRVLQKTIKGIQEMLDGLA